MGNADKLLGAMRRNYKDWRIEQLIVVAGSRGVTVKQGRGSHVKFSHPRSSVVVTVPARRPIKAPYVKQFLELIDEVEQQS